MLCAGVMTLVMCTELEGTDGMGLCKQMFRRRWCIHEGRPYSPPRLGQLGNVLGPTTTTRMGLGM